MGNALGWTLVELITDCAGLEWIMASVHIVLLGHGILELVWIDG